jgi:hypothetical protein
MPARCSEDRGELLREASSGAGCGVAVADVGVEEAAAEVGVKEATARGGKGGGGLPRASEDREDLFVCGGK